MGILASNGPKIETKLPSRDIVISNLSSFKNLTVFLISLIAMMESTKGLFSNTGAELDDTKKQTVPDKKVFIASAHWVARIRSPMRSVLNIPTLMNCLSTSSSASYF